MRTEVLTDGEALRQLHGPWKRLHGQVGGTIFQTVEWLFSWWAVYKSRFGLRILTLWQDGDLVGLVPCYLGRNALGIYARSMGEHEVYGTYAPLVRPDAVKECAVPTAAFFARLLRKDRCDLIDFHHVPASTCFFDLLDPELGERQCLNVTVQKSLPRVVVQLPSDWDSYVRSLSSHERHFARMLARIERQPSPPFILRIRRDPEALDHLVRLHTLVWAGRGQRGFFGGRHGLESFFRTVLPGLLEDGTAAFYMVEAGGEVVAITVAFFTKGQSCAYLSGRLPTHPASKYSPGKALLMAIIRDSIAAGFASCDLMEGLMKYKFRVGGRLSWFSRHTIFQEGVRGAKARAFLALLAVRNRWHATTSSEARAIRTHREDTVGNPPVG